MELGEQLKKQKIQADNLEIERKKVSLYSIIYLKTNMLKRWKN